MQDQNLRNTIFRAAVYVRISKEDAAGKAESNSITNQKQLIFDYLKNKPEIEVVSVRIDDGYTGTNYDRPAFQRMLEDMKAGVVNCVVVKDLSRFGREYIDAGKYIDRLFPFYGVRLIAINDGIDTITRDSADDFSITFKNLFNDNYARDISVKTRSNLSVKRKNGEFVGAFASYGYQRSETEHNKLVIDEYAAAVVEDIFRWKISGMSQDAIAKKLNSMGILSPAEYKRSIGMKYRSGFEAQKKALWSAVAVRRILTNEIYIGTLIQGVRTTPNYKVKIVKTKGREECCILEDNHEPIIHKKTFELVQRLLLLDTRTSPDEELVFPLAGLIECGDCGSPMVRRITSANGKKYVYYICSKNKQHKGCSAHRIKKEQLEDTVLAVIQNQIQLVVELNRCLKMIENQPFRTINLKKAEERLQKLLEEGEKYRKLKGALYEDMKAGVVSKEDYKDIHANYEARIQSAGEAVLQVRREIEGLQPDSFGKQPWMEDFIAHHNLTQLTRTAVVKMIDKILVYEDKRVEVLFYHKEKFDLAAENIAAMQAAREMI